MRRKQPVQDFAGGSSRFAFSFVCSLTHSFPLVADVLGREVCVGVDSGQLDSVGLSDLQDLVVDAQCGHALLVSLGQSGLELVVSSDQTL